MARLRLRIGEKNTAREKTVTRYRLETEISADDLFDVILALTGKAIHITPLEEPEPEAPAASETPLANIPQEPARKRAPKGNGDDWPPPGGIYATVLDALKEGPKTSPDLREALKAGGFAGGSLNSALARLEEQGRARKTDEGAWIAA
jgi:hypothetical protein